jgi:undecaprenyl-diphosphatase
VQGIAIVPGISRSGITIAVALMLGVERELAARFSFLLSVPAILGALAFELRDVLPAAQGMPEIQGLGVMVIGVLVAAVTGIFALYIVLGVVRRGRISLFAYYCWALGALAIALSILKP